MALRYSQIINNQESLYFRVEIHDEDFVGTSSDFYLEDIEWDYKGQNNQRWQSIWASQLTIALQSTPTKDLTTLIDDILNADEAQFTVKVYKSTDGINYSFYWIGVILTDLSGGLDEAPVQSFQLVATDSILGNHQKKQTVGMILWYCRKLDIDAAAFATHLRLKKYLYGNDIERLINMEKVLKEMLVQKSKK